MPSSAIFFPFMIEAAILKVYGSESLDYVVDEAVQIFGGMGFSAEMPVDRGYRDSRINRIFEGTNEINRILIVDTLLKRGQKKDIPLFEKAAEAYEGLRNNGGENLPEGYYELKRYRIEQMKKAVLAIINAVTEKFARKLVFEQEILKSLSDMIMNIYVAESSLLRVWKLSDLRGEEAVSLYKDILDIIVYDTADIVRKSGLDAVNSFAEGEEYDMLKAGVESLTKTDKLNPKEARRRIAEKLIEENKYAF